MTVARADVQSAVLAFCLVLSGLAFWAGCFLLLELFLAIPEMESGCHVSGWRRCYQFYARFLCFSIWYFFSRCKGSDPEFCACWASVQPLSDTPSL